MKTKSLFQILFLLIVSFGNQQILALSEIDSVATVYNFEVENTHTYVVGNAQLYVHNTCVVTNQLLSSGKLHPDDVAAFTADFGGNNFMLNKFASGEITVDAWKIMQGSPNRANIDFLKFYGHPEAIAARNVVLGTDIPTKFPDLSVDELTSIYYYTTDAYFDLNRALRGVDPMNPQLEAFNKVLNQSLDKLPKYSQPTFRGTTMSDIVLINYENAFNNGGKITEQAFMSSSKESNVALSFADDILKPNHKKVFLKVNGKNGVDVEQISAYGPTFDPTYSESEILFKSGLEFKVIEYSEMTLPNGEIYIKITLEE